MYIQLRWKVLYCQRCGKSIKADQQSQVTNRIITVAHHYRKIISISAFKLFSSSSDRKSQVIQHLSGNKHIATASRSSSKQVLLDKTGSLTPQIRDLRTVVTFILICVKFSFYQTFSLRNVNNPVLRKFLVKYTNLDTPDEST